jgi:LDH2 family malate/lactate/ureidoglycolate dehydrogenase
MNRPPETYVQVQEERLLAFAIACFERAGLDNHHASTISRLLVNSDLRGVRSHGTRTVNHYCKALEEGKLNTKPNIRQVHETPSAKSTRHRQPSSSMATAHSATCRW